MEPGGSALVTGASRGIGRAVSLELCRRGFDVVATMRNLGSAGSLTDEADAIDTSDRGSFEVRLLDVTDPTTIEFPEDLRVLVNNAGLDRANLPVEETAATEWQDVFETNVFGLVEVTRKAIPTMRAAGGGVIVNMTSAGLLLPMPFFALYRASKAAVSAFGESLRVELAPHGIRVIEILPGPIDTDMLASSATVPEAVAYEAYRKQAERVGELREGIDQVATPVGEAATAIVDAIVSDDPARRYACDLVGAQLLETVRTTPDEELQAGLLAAMSVEP